MKQSKPFTPMRIRKIRKYLDLTQEEAGRLLGGGPRAFAKYETGALKPSAALINLLRILEIDPSILSTLKGEYSSAADHSVPTPFEVTGADIACLSPEPMSQLLRRLLIAEAAKFNLPMNGISVPSNINAPDGGEDGRISLEKSPPRNSFLPFRLCQFQLKTGKIYPGRAAKEVLTRRGDVKPLIHSVLESGGYYIMLCAQRYNQRQIEERQRAICDALSKMGFVDVERRVRFWDADQIATWVNSHSSVALWVREEVGSKTLGDFATWKHWRSHSEHSVSWAEDPRLAELIERLRSNVTKPRGVLQVVGLSGIGKTRLCLEALNRLGEVAGRPLQDFVMYAVQPQEGAQAIIPIVEKLAISGGRAIMVVDDCDQRTSAKLDRIISRADSCLSLITIHNEIPEQIKENTHEIDNAPTTTIKSILEDIAEAMSDVDRDRLARLSGGFPEIAIRIARESEIGENLIDPVNDDFIDQFVCGRRSTENGQLLQSAQLLAVFRTIRVDSTEKEFHVVGKESSFGDHITKIAELSHQLNSEDLHKQIEGYKGLVKRGIVKPSGRLRAIEPRPIAVRLAERQWMDWIPEKWDRVLTGDIGADLNVSAARRLAELNSTEIAQQVADYVLRQNGPFDRPNSIHLPGRAEVLSALAEINPCVVAEYIKLYLGRLGDLHQLGENLRSTLVRMLRKIVFHSKSFEISARLLLRLEVSKPYSLVPEDSRYFAKLFSPVLGGTEAEGKTRLSFLVKIIDESNETSNQGQLKYIVDALGEGSMMMGKYFRMVGPEVQGSRKALDSWLPASKEERDEYRMGCVKLLGELAKRNDCVGKKARSDLSRSISYLIRDGFLKEVKNMISMVTHEGHSWTMALRQLKASLASKSGRMDDDTSEQIRSLIKKLEPDNLRERVRLQVTEPPMPELRDKEWSVEEDFRHRRAIAQSLAGELLQESPTLKEILPEISRGRQFMAYELGEALAKSALSPLTWLEPIVQAVKSVPASNRSYDLLTGFVVHLPGKFQDEVEEFKMRAIESPELVSAFPMICGRAGLRPEDIDRAIDALNRGVLTPWDLRHWAFTWVLKKVSPYKVALLLDAMLDHSAPSFALAVTILGRILGDENDENKKGRSGSHVFKIADFRPQLLKMIQNACRWSTTDFRPPTRGQQSGIQPDMVEYHFEEIVQRMLAKGREDSDACKTVLELARTLVHGDDHDLFYSARVKSTSVLGRMLTGYPDIVWPIVGGAIMESPQFANHMRYFLGQPYILERDFIPPILDVPEDILFAWCHANPDGAPAFMAQCAPFLSKEDGDMDCASLHPVMSRLLDEFGERDDVHKALEGHIHPYHWVDSCAGHYARLEKIFQHLIETHSNLGVRQWAEKMRFQAARSFKQETIRDEERKAQWR
jgi:transcriptional regulator with XRE-family HTH domain